MAQTPVRTSDSPLRSTKCKRPSMHKLIEMKPTGNLVEVESVHRDKTGVYVEVVMVPSLASLRV